MSAFNGSGSFVISGSGLPYVAGTTISSTVANQLNTDLATGLSTCITKDGQSLPTANIPMGGFKLTGLAAATAAGDALSYTAIGSWTPVDGSGAGLVYTNASGTYTKIGQLVFITGQLIYPVTASGANAAIGGLPATSSTVSRQVIPLALSTGNVPTLIVHASVTIISLTSIADVAITNAGISGTQLAFSGCYLAVS